jgi:hypothetical protein
MPVPPMQHNSLAQKRGNESMRGNVNSIWVALVFLATTAAAQTVTGSGTGGTVPVFTGSGTSSTIGNSPISISVSTSTALHSGLMSTTSSANPGATSAPDSFTAGLDPLYAWDAITAQVTNPSTANSTQYFGYIGNPAVTSTDATSRIVVGGEFAPSFVASGGSSSNYIYGVVGNGFLGSPSATSGYTSLYGAAFGAGTAPTVPAATTVGGVNVARMSPLIQSGSVATVRGVWVTPVFGSTTGPANLNIPTYYGLELGTPSFANGATVTTNYGISQEDSAAKNYFAGKIGIGTASPGQKLEVNGSIKLTAGSGGSIIFPDGSVQSVAANGICGGDYAESIDVTGDRTAYAPGDLLVLDPEHPGKFLKSAEPYSTSVSGIYSTKPGMVGRRQLPPKSDAELPMAVIGIVPAKVSNENGPVKVGDLLVSSSTAGYAMKGTDRSRMLGAVIGKAMGTLDSDKGVIEVLVTLQ